ncbi:MAG: hypothetical protein KGL48_14055 [Sphingomonadales bacterium]|nr:hypothetical protein [Sphingomonadales bacterium]
MRFIAIAALLLAPGVAQADVPASYRVSIVTRSQGHDVRVRIKGDRVSVLKKSVFGGRSPELRTAMIAAVHDVTGCTMADPYWDDMRLRGTLDCAGKAPRNPH